MIKTKTKGLYELTFQNKTKSVAYKVRPVFEGEDYNKAFKRFKENNRRYTQAFLLRKKENLAIEKVNKIQTAKNDLIDKHNDATIAKNKIAQANYEKFQQIYANELSAQNNILSNYVIRTFNINGFGKWNCDVPIQPFITIPISLKFKDEKGNAIELNDPYVVYENLNTIFPCSNQTLNYSADKASMIWGVAKGEFYYFTYVDFKNAGFSAQTKEQDIIMHNYFENPMSYKKIQQLVGLN